ncbi:MAG: hypothetical protein FJ279_28650 [Planctomycetes bacterium]|nr:hypothetical protein [Planctomycetota bacterium]
MPGCLISFVASVVLLFLFSLEVITGEKRLPRIWWLWDKPEAICLVCSEHAARYILPTETEKETELRSAFQVCMISDTVEQQAAYQRFVNRRLPKDVNRTDTKEVKRAFCSERYWISRWRWERYGGLYGKSRYRWEVAVETKDRAMLWNQVIGWVLHAGAWLVVVLIGFSCVAYVWFGAVDLVQRMKQRKSPAEPKVPTS